MALIVWNKKNCTDTPLCECMCVCVCVCVCVCARSAVFDPLTLPIRTFWVIKGKEKKQIIYLYISVVIVFFFIWNHFEKKDNYKNSVRTRL